MERLTSRYESGIVNIPAGMMPEVLERLAAYEDTGLEPEEIKELIYRFEKCRVIRAALCDPTGQPVADPEHMRDLIKAEQDGRMVVLPAKTVFELTWDAGPECDLVCPAEENGNGCCDFCDNGKLFVYERPCTQERLKELGKTVFLTRAEAEAALVQKGGALE